MFRLSSLLNAFKTHQRLANDRKSRRQRLRNRPLVTSSGESLERKQLLTVIEWGGNINGDWSNAANWSPTFVPGADDDVIIDASNGIAFEVDLNVNATINSLTVNSPDATLDIEASRTLTINNASSFDDGRVRLNTNARVIGNGTLTNSAVVDVLGTTVQVTAPLVQNGVLNIGATDGGASVNLTTNSFSNSGTINLGAANSTAARLITNVGESFTNAATGTVNVVSAAGSSAEITGDVVNEGAINADADFEFDGRTATVTNRGTIEIAAGTETLIGDFNTITFIQESGSLTVDGLLQTDADTFRFTGGEIDGANIPVVNNGTLDLDASAGPIDVIAAGLVTLAGDIGTGQVVRLQNDGFREGEITSANGFTNSGTILFERDPDSTAERKAKLRVTAGALTNAVGGVIDIVDNDGQISVPSFNNAGSFNVSRPTTFFFDTVNNSGTFDIGTDIDITDRDVTFENTGVLTVAAGNELRLSGTGNTFRQNAGTLQLDGDFITNTDFVLNGGDIVGNSPVVDGGDLAYGGGLTNNETIIARNTVEMESNLPAGQTLIVQADVRTALLRVNDQFTIDGTVRLEQTAGSTQTARIQAGGGNDEIIIGATGTLDLQPGTATQPFTLQAITNRGTIDVNSDVEFNGSGGRQLVNEGQINVPIGITFGLTNSGFGVPGLLHEAGSLNVDGTLTAAGILKSGGGAFEGDGDIIVNSGDLEIEAGNDVEFDITARGFVDIVGDLAASQIVRAESIGTNQTVLIVQDGFMNSGTITFDSIDGSTSSARLQTGSGPGTLNNAAGGTIDVNTGGGNFQFTLTTLNNSGDVFLGRDVELAAGDILNNDGNFVVEAGTTFHLDGGTLNQNSGTLDLLGELTSNGNFAFNGGNIIGDNDPLLLGGTLSVASDNSNPATFNAQRSITLNSDLNANQTVNLQPQTTSQLTLNVGNTFTNGGTINFDPAAGATGLISIQPTSFTTAVVTNNGTLSSLAGSGRILAAQLDNTGNLSVAGDLNLAGDMIINNTGDFDISAGGELTVGNSSASGNPVFNQQNGSLNNDGTFFAAIASVFNFDGGTIDGSQPVRLKNSDLNIADGNFNVGHFRFEGSSNDLFDDIAAGQRVDIAAIGSAGGTLRVPAGFVNAGELLLDETAATTGSAVLQVGNNNDPITNTATGIILGDGEVRASTLTSAGTIAPGASPGSLNIDADLVLQNSSVIAIELGGVTAGTQFDQLVVDHDTTLAGELQLSIIDAFVPTAGNTFEVLTFPSVQGDFAIVSGTDAGNGAVLEKNLNAQDVTIEVIAPPGLTIGDVSIVEGDSGTINAVFTVNLEANGNPVSVDFATEDQTALAGEDYTATSGTLNFASNETSKTISVPIVGDERDENEETFRVLLSNAANAAIPDPEGIATINDGDDPQPAASFAEATSNIAEDGGTLTLIVQLDRPSGLATSVDFSVTGGTATNRSGSTGDFNLAAGTLNFAADQTTQTIEIPITDDSVVEGTETIELSLSNAVNATIGATGNHTVSIDDNDFHPDLLVASSNSPDSANRGGTISVEWVVRNSGQGDAIGSLSDRVYFSTDDTLDDNDTILATRNSSGDLPLAAGASYTATQNVDLPDVDPGDYFLIFETDSSNQITEDSDANNTRTEAIELLGPDLIISPPTHQRLPPRGQTSQPISPCRTSALATPIVVRRIAFSFRQTTCWMPATLRSFRCSVSNLTPTKPNNMPPRHSAFRKSHPASTS